MRALLWVAAVAAVVTFGILGYYYVQFSRVIDQRLRGEGDRTMPRVFARAFELRKGAAMDAPELVDRLNDLGYTQRPSPELPGEFTASGHAITIVARGGDHRGRHVRVTFGGKGSTAKAASSAAFIDGLQVDGAGTEDTLVLETPLLTALLSGGREKRRKVPLAGIPRVVQQAVLSIEDRRFYEHPGVDVIRSVGAIVTNLRGDRPYLVGGSTLTQQMVKNIFLTKEKTLKRKLLEQFMALVLERRLSKNEILELYLNEVYLGQRGSFAIHGVAEAARLFFGKDVSNLSLPEAATIAGVIQAPYTYSPFRNTDRAKQRRNLVLRSMVESGVLAKEEAERAALEPVATVASAVDTEGPYFVDHITQGLLEQYPALLAGDATVEIYSTLDIHLQRLAQVAMRDGLAKVDEVLQRKRPGTRAQGALLAVDPRTGDVLAMVGGRTYNQSQYNRVTGARRQPGSVFKPFLYLAAFEFGAADGFTPVTPATTVIDEPTTFYFGDEEWSPGNYGDEYDGEITLRRALAMSRNSVAAKVAEQVGYRRVAELWKRVGTSTQPKPYPSIALGVFEATPWEIVQAYTTFPNGGETRPLRGILRLSSDGKPLEAPPLAEPRRVARPETAFLVTNMMRSVINEGTGAAARGAGFSLDAAGKSGTTNELRDAWFVGFTPELLTVVWVGFDDNQALGLSGSQAALPIWTAFMMRALAGHANLPFASPASGVTYAEIDRDTGKLAVPGCLRTLREAFLSGTEPTEVCELHRF